MDGELYSRKRKLENSSLEQASRKYSANQGPSSNGHRQHEAAASRRTYEPSSTTAERSSPRNEYERRARSSGGACDSKTNQFRGKTDWLAAESHLGEEGLEPPGTESSTLQYMLTSRVPFATWKDRLYQELAELNCLFTVEPAMKKKANMLVDDELKYRSLATAIIGMRLDDAHLALVANMDDPLMVMKVLRDFREPENRNLELKARQRLNSLLYDASVPVREFVRSFENLVKEVEKYSGERISEDTMKQHLLSAVISDFPNLMVGCQALSTDIRYEDLKRLLFEAVDLRNASKNASGKTAASKNVAAVGASEKDAVGRSVRVEARGSEGVSAKGSSFSTTLDTNKKSQVAEVAGTSKSASSKSAEAVLPYSSITEQRAAGSSAVSKGDKVEGQQYPSSRHTTSKNIPVEIWYSSRSERRGGSSSVSSKSSKGGEQLHASRNKMEMDEQIESDRRIQELVKTNPRLASKETSCTKCGAFGHVANDCKRADHKRKCYSCLKFVDDHVASTCPERGDYAVLPIILKARTNAKFAQESVDPRPPVDPRPTATVSSSPSFAKSLHSESNLVPSVPPKMPDGDGEEDLSDELPPIDGLRQVYHIRRRVTIKKLKTGRTVRKDLIFTDSDFYTDIKYREMFIEEGEEEPGDIILETIKVMTTNKD